MSEDSGSGPCFSRNTRLIRAAYVRGEAGVGGSLSAFLLDYSWTELWENTLKREPSQEFCFVLIHFSSVSLRLFVPVRTALCIAKLLEKGPLICMSLKQRLTAWLLPRFEPGAIMYQVRNLFLCLLITVHLSAHLKIKMWVRPPGMK